MSDDHDHDAANRVPGWFVTFADMMTLLMAFFVLLLSMNEIGRGNARQQAVASARRAYREQHAGGPLPEIEPRDPVLRHLLTKGWEQQNRYLAAAGAGTNGESPDPEEDSTAQRTVPLRSTSTLTFDADSTALTEQAREALRRLSRSSRRLSSQSPTIEIRASGIADSAGGDGSRPSIDLARCAAILNFLVHDEQIPERRCRLTILPERTDRGPFESQLGGHPRPESIQVILTAERLKTAGRSSPFAPRK